LKPYFSDEILPVTGRSGRGMLLKLDSSLRLVGGKRQDCFNWSEKSTRQKEEHERKKLNLTTDTSYTSLSRQCHESMFLISINAMNHTNNDRNATNEKVLMYLRQVGTGFLPLGGLFDGNNGSPGYSVAPMQRANCRSSAVGNILSGCILKERIDLMHQREV